MRWRLGSLLLLPAMLAAGVAFRTHGEGMSVGMCASASIGTLLRGGGACRSSFALRAPPRSGRSTRLVAPVCHTDSHEPGVALDVDGVDYGLVACGTLVREDDTPICDGQPVRIAVHPDAVVVSVGDRIVARLAPSTRVGPPRWCAPG